MAISDSEWKRRTLCSDGNCIGIIGKDGRCKVCGLAYEGDLPEALDEVEPNEQASAEIQAKAPEDAVDLEPDADAGGDPATGGDAWADRILCIDGNCIGVIGPDGRCKECGKAHPGSRS